MEIVVTSVSTLIVKFTVYGAWRRPVDWTAGNGSYRRSRLDYWRNESARGWGGAEPTAPADAGIRGNAPTARPTLAGARRQNTRRGIVCYQVQEEMRGERLKRGAQEAHRQREG
jgi:hypothetical protein